MSTDQPYGLGKLVTGDHHYALLEYVLKNHLKTGVALEFGVGKADSTRLIAQHIAVVGFDSFEGLPEDWRTGYPRGAFRFDQPVIDNAHFVKGLFADTLESWGAWDNVEKVALVHIDCDLYSSTKTVLEYLGEKILTDKPCIVFDEWYGYDGCWRHEQRAWAEFAGSSGVGWRVLGHGHEAWGIEIV